MHQISYESAKPGNNYLLVLDGVDHYYGNLIGRLNKSEAPQQQALENASDISLRFAQAYLNQNNSVPTSFASMPIDGYSKIVSFEHR
jgi:hypothetical protein